MITFGIVSIGWGRSPAFAVRFGASHVQLPGTTHGGQTVGGSSGGGELRPGRDSEEMINDCRSDSDRQVLIKRVGEHLLPTSRSWWPWWPSSPIAAPDTGTGHIDLFCYRAPTQALVTQLRYLISRSGTSGSADAAHGDAGTLQVLAHRARMNAQLRTDLAEGPALGVQLGCTLNVHRATVTAAALGVDVDRQNGQVSDTSPAIHVGYGLIGAGTMIMWLEP